MDGCICDGCVGVQGHGFDCRRNGIACEKYCCSIVDPCLVDVGGYVVDHPVDPGFAGGVRVVYYQGDGLGACGDCVSGECRGAVLAIAGVFDWQAGAVVKGI